MPGEIEGIERGASNANVHDLRPRSEEKDKTIVVRKDMLESAQRLNKIVQKARIEWEGSDVTPKHIQSLQDELDRRGIAVPDATASQSAGNPSEQNLAPAKKK